MRVASVAIGLTACQADLFRASRIPVDRLLASADLRQSRSLAGLSMTGIVLTELFADFSPANCPETDTKEGLFRKRRNDHFETDDLNGAVQHLTERLGVCRWTCRIPLGSPTVAA